jgi:hypothetical protein
MVGIAAVTTVVSVAARKRLDMRAAVITWSRAGVPSRTVAADTSVAADPLVSFIARRICSMRDAKSR